MRVSVTKTKGTDLLRMVNLNMIEGAYKRGMSLSAHLELFDPSDAEEYRSEDTDAFQRLLRQAQVITRSFAGLGLRADTGDEFIKKVTRAAQGTGAQRVSDARAEETAHILFCEYLTRQWKSVGSGEPFTMRRALYASNDYSPGTSPNPYAQAPTTWDKQIAPQIPVNLLVSRTTLIDSDTYRAFYLTDDPANSRFLRVTEAAEIPGAKLTGGETLIQLFKYGRKLVITYETMRRMTMDQISLHIARMGVQAEVDKLATVMDVLVNGDGNAGTAATSFNLTALDPAATANNPTVTALIAFRAKFRNPYMLDVLLGQELPMIKLQTLNMGSANIPLVMMPPNLFGSLRPINNQLAVGPAFGISDDAPANKWLGFDSRLALEHIMEVGATIQEIQRFITNQTQALTMTETEGWRILDKGAAKLVNLAA